MHFTASWSFCFFSLQCIHADRTVHFSVRWLWYLSHRRPAKAQASLHIRAASLEPSLFAHTKCGSRRRVRSKQQTSSPTGWLRMRVWRMSLRRTKSAIISWDGSNDKKGDVQKSQKYKWATSWENLFLPYANNKGADQPAHPRSLISAFVIRCLDSIISVVSICKISSL